MTVITKQIEFLIQEFSRAIEWTAGPDEDRIKVGELSSKMAMAYEKLRNALEYHEEHLLRRNAIARILKRRMTKGTQGATIARSLVEELIRAKYLPNNAIPERLVENVAMIIDKHIFFINKAAPGKRARERKELFFWQLGMLSSELEESLTPHFRERALVDVMYRMVQEEVVFVEQKMSERDKALQLYLAVNRSLLKADVIWLQYQMLKLYYPEWTKNDMGVVAEAAGRSMALKQEIEKTLKHPLAGDLARQLQPYAVIFWIIKDILEKEPKRAENIFTNPNILDDFVKDACSTRYQRSYVVLRRSAIRSVVFILCTKIILALIIELPYDWYIEKHIAWLPLSINIFFHPTLMMLIAATTRVPRENNTARVIEGVRWLVYGKGQEKIHFKTKRLPQPNTVKGLLTNVFYAVMYLVTFGVIFSILNRLGFNMVSAGLFVFFLSVVSFFGIRIRQSARELIVINKKENLISTLFDFFTLPIVRAGRWISIKSQKINVFVFILDFIIEAPYKMLLEVFDDLIAFIKEKKEEIF